MKRKRMYGDRLVEEPIFQSIGYAVDNTLAEQRIVVRIEDEYSDHAALTPSRPRRTGEGPIAHVIHWRKRAREPALRATRVDRARRARHWQSRCRPEARAPPAWRSACPATGASRPRRHTWQADGAAPGRRPPAGRRRRRCAYPSRPVEIGRASCRERVCQDVKIQVVAVAFKKKKK